MSVQLPVLVQSRRMTLRRSSFVSMIVISLLAVVLSACSLAAPAPVGNVDSTGTGATGQQAPLSQAQPLEPMQLPARKPTAANGADLYQEKCVRCHGSLGRGDGEMAAQVQQQFGRPVADLTSDVAARAKTPEYWYQLVTVGNLQAGMPGFSGSLDVNQRWDVIAYVWTLSAPPAQIAKGQEVYVKQCVQCHGETGKGDGPDAKEKLSDFSQIATFASIEAGRLDQELASTHIPSFAGTTSELERRAAIDYIRTFAYDAAPASGSTTTAASTPTAPTAPGTTAPAPAPAGEGITVQGYLINGTGGQPVPGNLSITFYIFPGGTGQTSITQTLHADAQGRFVVTTTQAAPGDLIAATTEYKQLNFFSSLEDYAPQVTVPITIYESTLDSAQVAISTLHIVASPGASGGLDVNEIYVLSNTGDKIVAGFGQPVMRLGLPASAVQVIPDTNMPPDVLVQKDGGLDYYDAIPVGDNGGQIVFQYNIPNGPFKLDRPLFQNVASVNLLVQGDPAQLSVTGGQLTAAGTQDMQGTTYQQFRASGLTAGQTLALTVAGPGGAFDWRILAGIGLVIVGVVGLVVWQRGRGKGVVADSSEAQRDALIDQIAALDDDFAAGGIDEVNYRAKRAKLKERLLKLM
ncbi:MAG: c-type cytochrome [Chloroflexi bacterium]|nr:c-type cytochrome [Chloroflexota bacterium]